VKKLVLSLLGAAAVAMISSNAMALDTTRQFSAILARGPFPVPAGTLMFEFSQDIPFQACQYFAEWVDTAFLPLSGQCAVDEAKTHGNFSCLQNSLLQVPSVVTLEPSIPCYGFDDFQQFRQVFMLMVGESFGAPDMEGLIQFTGAVPIVYGFELVAH
jgi:hypothetical protein